MLAGLCSVTFRDRGVGEVADRAAAAGLSAVEWGGDVHVPPGDLQAASAAVAASDAAGLRIVSYGSYLFCDRHAVDALPAVLDTAEALGTELVRVWAPFGVGPTASPGERRTAARAVAAVAEAAGERGLAVYLEFHAGTLTATALSAIALLEEVGADNLTCAWQPPYWDPRPVEGEVADLALLAPHLAHVHVYAWQPDGTRLALVAESHRWPTRLAAARATPAVPAVQRSALLEFVAGDDPAAFSVDAATLLGWLGEPHSPGAPGGAGR